MQVIKRMKSTYEKRRRLIDDFESAQSITDVLDCTQTPSVCEKFQKLFSNRSSKVVVVGNGPVDQDFGDIVDSADIVVRMNMFKIDPPKTGSKLDIHVVYELIKSDVQQAVPTIVVGCTDKQKNYVGLTKWMAPMKRDLLHRICETDPSRGFVTIALMLRFFDSVSIIGFGGMGHTPTGLTGMQQIWFYVCNLVGNHDINEEHNVIKKLIRENRLVSIAPIPFSRSREECIFLVVVFSLMVASVMTALVLRVRSHIKYRQNTCNQ